MTLPSDPWASLRASTRARIGLGRTGDAPPLGAILDFQLAHARARDAVHTPLDVPAVTQATGARIVVRSAAADRATYLRRPDLGRRLDPDSRVMLSREASKDGFDAVFVLADGLSPAAVQRFAPPLLDYCLARLQGWSIAPVVIATQARVALGDEIGELLGASLGVVLIGERPGLSVANSLGVYLTWQPRAGRRDAERNCISNIHADGLPCAAAGDMLVWLMTEARRRKLSGVELKADGALEQRSSAAIAPPDRPSSGA